MTRNPRTDPRMAPSCSLVSTELLEVAWAGAAGGGGGGGGSRVGVGRSSRTPVPRVTRVVMVVEALVRVWVITRAAVTWRSAMRAMGLVLHNYQGIGIAVRGNGRNGSESLGEAGAAFNPRVFRLPRQIPTNRQVNRPHRRSPPSDQK
jgi:hypothetical protein